MSEDPLKAFEYLYRKIEPDTLLDGALDDVPEDAALQIQHLERQNAALHRQFSALFEQLNDGVFIIEVQRMICIQANDAAARMLGYEPEEIIGQKPSFFVDPLEHGQMQIAIEHALQGSRLPLYERYLRRKDGSRILCEINLFPIRDNAGQALYLQSIVREITERKRIEYSLRQRQHLFETFVANLPDRTLIFDRDGNYQQLLKLEYDTGLQAPDVTLGASLYDYFDKPFVEFCLRKIRLAMDSRTPQTFEYSYTFPSGSYDFEGRVIPFNDPMTDEALVIWIARDITERKRAERDRITLELEQERVRFLQDFISGMTHDLQTPLSVLRTSLYLLERVAPEKRKQQISVMERQIDRLTQMIEDMLMVARLEYLPDIVLQPVSVAPMLLELYNQMQPKAQQAQISFQLELQEYPAIILGSPDELNRAFLNLVDNALNYSKAGGRVHVRLSSDGSYYKVEVEDSGIGIPEEDLPHIFTRLYRAKNAHEIRRGTGLGLAIVKRVVGLLQGEIEVESRLNVGTVFRIYLPMMPT